MAWSAAEALATPGGVLTGLVLVSIPVLNTAGFDGGSVPRVAACEADDRLAGAEDSFPIASRSKGFCGSGPNRILCRSHRCPIDLGFPGVRRHRSW